eukprot:5984578-Amphidinium_carterae.3
MDDITSQHSAQGLQSCDLPEPKRAKQEPSLQLLLDELRSFRHDMNSRVVTMENHVIGMGKRLTAVEDQQRELQKSVSKIDKAVEKALAGRAKAKSAPPKSAKSSGSKDRELSPHRDDGAQKDLVIVGGFPENTTRAQLLEHSRHYLSHVHAEQTPIDVFSPKVRIVRCSFFLMRFEHSGLARDFVAAANKRPAFQHGGNRIWASLSKTKEERDRNKLLRALGNHFVTNYKMEETAVEFSWRGREVWVAGHRPVYYHFASNKWIIDKLALRALLGTDDVTKTELELQAITVQPPVESS